MTETMTKNSISRSRRSRTKSKTKTDTSGALGDIIKEMSNLTGEKLMKFVFGILSQFFPPVDKLYADVMKLWSLKDLKLAECFDAAKMTPQVENLSIIESTLNSAQKEITNKKQYCENTKKKFKDWHDKVMKEHNSKEHGSFFGGAVFIFSDGWTDSQVCNNGWKYSTAAQKAKYPAGEKEYIRECMYFMDLDCDKFDPEGNSLKDFAQQAWNYVKSVWASLKCLQTKLSINPVTKKILDALKGAFVTGAFSAAANLGLQILTGGVWGGLKSAYQFVQLGLAIKQYAQGLLKQDKHWVIGQLVGMAALIIKGLILGRRRRRRMTRMK